MSTASVPLWTIQVQVVGMEGLLVPPASPLTTTLTAGTHQEARARCRAILSHYAGDRRVIAAFPVPTPGTVGTICIDPKPKAPTAAKLQTGEAL